jgi:hypothetical protein
MSVIYSEHAKPWNRDEVSVSNAVVSDQRAVEVIFRRIIVDLTA